MRRVLVAIVGLSFLAGVLVTMPDDPKPVRMDPIYKPGR